MKRVFKLETYLLVTNLLHGIFWTISGISDCIKHTPTIINIGFLVLALSFLILYFFILFSNREPFDEFSQNIMEKTDSNVLILLIMVLVICGLLGDSFSLLKKEIVVPWYALAKIIAGLAYCARYVVFMIMEKQFLDNNVSEENVKD